MREGDQREEKGNRDREKQKNDCVEEKNWDFHCSLKLLSFKS